MKKNSRIFIIGGNSAIAAGIAGYLKARNFTCALTDTHCGIDPGDPDGLPRFFEKERPEYIFLTYVRSGGINANKDRPADFIYMNLQVQNNVIRASHAAGVKKLLFFASTCIYPRDRSRPIREDDLLSGPLEETSEPYALSKISGIKLCQAFYRQYGSRFISCVPATIYGPNDDFDPETAHVLPALIRRFHDAKMNGKKRVDVWGTGSARREFIYVEDAVDACIFLMNNYDSPDIINIGCGKDLSVRELAGMIKETVGFDGEVGFDPSRPEGAPRKLLDSGKIKAMGWNARVGIKEGIDSTYGWYKENLL